MTREEAKTVFLNRGYVEVEGGTIYNPDKWREACVVISEWLEQEPVLDKIRAEIDEISLSEPMVSADGLYCYGSRSITMGHFREKVFEIIDKYKVESEDKNDK